MFGPALPSRSRGPSLGLPITPPSLTCPVSFGSAGFETSYWRTSPWSQLAK